LVSDEIVEPSHEIEVVDEQKLIGMESDATSKKPDLIDEDSDVDEANSDTENYHPCSPNSLTSSAPNVPDIESNNNNNNIISTKDNNNGLNIAFFEQSTEPTTKQKYHQSLIHHSYRHHHLETLPEVEHQVSPSELLSPNETTTAKQPTETSVNTATLKETKIATSKHISSTPTTPPSLGSRKISKTSIGPDKGLLFGLKNLMRLLDDLKSETLITTC
jgi:hypothetical protein